MSVEHVREPALSRRTRPESRSLVEYATNSISGQVSGARSARQAPGGLARLGACAARVGDAQRPKSVPTPIISREGCPNGTGLCTTRPSGSSPEGGPAGWGTA